MASQISRRTFSQFTISLIGMVASAHDVWALDYPTRTIRIVVGFPAGTAPDITARLFGRWMSERLRQQFIVDNRTGSGTNIATDIVAHAAPDGYTLLAIISSNTISATLYKNLNFDFVRDILPVGFIGASPFVLVVTPSLPVKTLPELLAYAKANPGKLNMASQGVGTTSHVCGELLKMMTGMNFVHVPYRGPLMPDLLAGQVQFYFSPTAQAEAYIKEGRLRALGVTTTNRTQLLPDVPAVAEFVPGYEATAWFGIGAPMRTLSEIVTRLNTEMISLAGDSEAKKRLLALGIEPRAMSPAEFKTFVSTEVEKWAKVIAFANIKPD